VGDLRGLLGKKNVNGNPRIEMVTPSAALPGGEVRIIGSGLRPPALDRPRVLFGEAEGSVVISSEKFVVARVPDNAFSGNVTVVADGHASNPQEFRVAVPVADNLHPVANPALDPEANIYVTFSGSRGQKAPVSIYKIDANYASRPFVSDAITNATGVAFGADGMLYVSSRLDGTVYRVSSTGMVSTYAEGLGVATGICFGPDGSLFVGDRTGTIWRIDRDRQMFVYATLEPSVAAYHLAFGTDGLLYVSGPTTSSYEAIWRVDSHGSVEAFYRGLGRPQGIAFDREGNLYVAASLSGRRGIVMITPDRKASLAVAGQNLVGLAFAPGGAMVLASNSAVFHLGGQVHGRPLVES
jgi:sugar lactone lactonase YvrE